MKDKDFIKGLKSGIPIGLGYFAVSITFGITAVLLGLNIWQATLISMLTLTSAGQVAGLNIMIIPGFYIDMFISQLTINLRYSFMSVALSQKTESKFKGMFKVLLGFFITDEIFAVAVSEEKITRKFFMGIAVLPYVGWVLGTLLGALLGNILPEVLMGALSIAIYGMFIAIIIPPSKKDIKTLIVVLITIAISCAFYYLPYINKISTGISISICAILAAILGALFFPRKEETLNE
jgi:predicted branched-subunit amino acid permease